MKKRTLWLLSLLVIFASISGLYLSGYAATFTKRLIATQDVKWWDGVTDTFTAETADGLTLTLNKVGYEVNVADTYGTLAAAVAGVGSSNNRVLYLKPTTWTISDDLTVPSNLTLRIPAGATLSVATDTTLTINGPIEAGPYQIFSWSGTGAVDISGSPTANCPFDWWGPTSGTSADNSDEFEKAFESMGAHQTLYLGSKTWRITSTTTFDKSANCMGWRLKGDNRNKALIYIDVGANVGIVFGNASYVFDNLVIEDVGFVGPANCCTYGVHFIRCTDTLDLNRVHFYMGATQWAAWFQGTVNGHIRATGGQSFYGTGNLTSCDSYANGLLFDATSGGNASNALKIDFRHSNGTTQAATALKIEDVTGSDWMSVYEVTGTYEYCTSYPVIFTKIRNFSLHDAYMSDGNSYGPKVDGCRFGELRNLYSVHDTEITASRGIRISDCSFTDLTIDAKCLNILLGGIQTDGTNTFHDYGVGTVYYGPVTERNDNHVYSNDVFDFPGQDQRNIIGNALFNRFDSNGPIGWSYGASNTWAQESTYVHWTPNSAKLSTNSADTNTEYTLSADQLRRVQGQYVTFSIWLKIASGQTFNDYPKIQIVNTPATWAGSTAYVRGDTVLPATDPGSVQYIVADDGGDSDSDEPTWPGLTGTVVDNEITWFGIDRNGTQESSTPMVAADVGNWRKLTVSAYIGQNCTAVSLKIWLYRQDDTSDADLYIAEPYLGVGSTSAMGVIPGDDENWDAVEIRGNRISFASYIPSNASSEEYSKAHIVGDRCFNDGSVTALTSGNVQIWGCTAAGTPGTWAVVGNVP
jgi:hypothetical protein